MYQVSATNLDLEPKVITIHDTDSEPVPPYLGRYTTIPGTHPWVLIPHPDQCHAHSVSKGVILQNPHILHISKVLDPIS